MPTKCKHKDTNGNICTKSASYNFKGETKRLYCATHKLDGMVSTRADKRSCIECSKEGISKRPSFNYPTEKKPLFCKTHSTDGMVNFNNNNKNNMCKGCNIKQPSYGIIGKKATHCSKCATKDMVDLISNLCGHTSEQSGECRKNATYGILGSKATRCKTHADKNMYDVKNKKCVVCVSIGVKKPKQPTFGIDKPTHCIEHKDNNMIDLKHSTEICKSCKTRATFGYLGEKAMYCVEHKKEDMIDIVSKMCSNCHNTQGVFGFDKNKLYCKFCSTTEMTNVIAKMCEKCNVKQPYFNYPTEKKGRFCAGCQLDGMVDIINPRCKSCGLFMVCKKPHLCAYCKPSSTLRQKTREMNVVNFLKDNDIEFVHNKSVGFVCGNYRPDIKIDAGTHFVIVEVDEDQHRQYEQRCELIRMFNIKQAEGLRCIFLRYNPDVFRVKNKAVKVFEKIRLKILLKEIEKHMKTVPEEEMSVYRLFYNNNDGNHVKKYDATSLLLKLISI